MPLLPDPTRKLERYVKQLMDESDRLTEDERQQVIAARNAITAARSSRSIVVLDTGINTMIPAAEEQIRDIWNRHHPDAPCELRRPFWRRFRG